MLIGQHIDVPSIELGGLCPACAFLVVGHHKLLVSESESIPLTHEKERAPVYNRQRIWREHCRQICNIRGIRIARVASDMCVCGEWYVRVWWVKVMHLLLPRPPSLLFPPGPYVMVVDDVAKPTTSNLEVGSSILEVDKGSIKLANITGL